MATKVSQNLIDRGDGTVSIPAYNFVSALGTGMLRIDGNGLGFATGGVRAIKIDSAQQILFGDFQDHRGAQAGSLHIRTGWSGLANTTNVGTAGDELILEGSGNAGLTVLTSNTNYGVIRFADPEATAGAGFIRYQHSTDIMELAVANAIRVNFESDKLQSLVPVETTLSFSGSYGTHTNNTGNTSDWGATMYGMGPSFDGANQGSTWAPTSLYGTAWVRGTHSEFDGAIGEGMYVYVNGVLRGGIGAGGTLTGDLTIFETNPRITMIDSDGTNIGEIVVDGNSMRFEVDAASNTSTSQHIFRVDGNDAVKIDNGLRIIANGIVLGNGVTFAAANHLQNYEEGTWTPTLFGTTTVGTPTYDFQDGTYTRIGNQVHIQFRLGITAKGGMVGSIRIGGLPFNTASTYYSGGITGWRAGISITSGDNLVLHGTLNQNNIRIQRTTNTSVGTLVDTQITDAFELRGAAMTYKTDEA